MSPGPGRSARRRRGPPGRASTRTPSRGRRSTAGAARRGAARPRASRTPARSPRAAPRSVRAGPRPGRARASDARAPSTRWAAGAPARRNAAPPPRPAARPTRCDPRGRPASPATSASIPSRSGATAAKPLGQRRVGSGVVVAHHHDHAIVDGERAHRLDALRERGRQLLGLERTIERAPVEVPEHHVLGHDLASVGRAPPERRPVDRRRHARQTIARSRPASRRSCGIWPIWPNWSGMYPRRRARAEPLGSAQSLLEVANVRLAAREELVHLRNPRTGGERARANERRHLVGTLRPHGEVVVDHRRLPVQVKVRKPGRAEIEQRVHHRHQPLAEDGEGLVPLAIPVGVRDQPHPDPRGVAHAAGPQNSAVASSRRRAAALPVVGIRAFSRASSTAPTTGGHCSGRSSARGAVRRTLSSSSSSR